MIRTVFILPSIYILIHFFMYLSIHPSIHPTTIGYEYMYTHIIHRYVSNICTCINESCTVLRHELNIAVTDSIFVIYLQTKPHSYIPHKALRVRKYFILIGHTMRCDYYITRVAMWSFCVKHML